MRYTTTAYCVDPDCSCLYRAGVILYDGPDRQAAEEARQQASAGYEIEIEEASGTTLPPIGQTITC